jgi:rhodanese-related sulfurtransferase
MDILMRTSYSFRVLSMAALFLCSHAAWSADNKAVAVDEMSAYLEFADYGGGTIFPERDPGQFGKEHIPGAINIEWRQVLAKAGQIPRDKPVLVYCNTGSLSAQAGFALRVAGWDNVRILQGGYTEWKVKGGMDAHLKATASPQH